MIPCFIWFLFWKCLWFKYCTSWTIFLISYLLFAISLYSGFWIVSLTLSFIITIEFFIFVIMFFYHILFFFHQMFLCTARKSCNFFLFENNWTFFSFLRSSFQVLFLSVFFMLEASSDVSLILSSHFKGEN